MRGFDFRYFVACLLAFPFMGGIYGLIAYAAIGIVVDSPLWPCGLTLFFLAFHIGDMKMMGWRDRVVRFLWVFVMAAAVSGIVWFFVPKEDWTQPPLLRAAMILPFLGAAIGLVLGLIEGVRRDTIYPRWRQLVAWWKALGGYGR
jgi:hypothetical protein